MLICFDEQRGDGVLEHAGDDVRCADLRRHGVEGRFYLAPNGDPVVRRHGFKYDQCEHAVVPPRSVKLLAQSRLEVRTIVLLCRHCWSSRHRKTTAFL
jgi:hypothetical protein